MKKALATMLVVVVVFSGSLAMGEDEGRKEKKTFMDIITDPFQSILAPVTGEGLAGLILKPLDVLTYPVAEFGESVTTPGRTKEYIYNINRNVSVIDAEDIKMTNPQYLQQIISRKAGIVVSGLLGNAKDNFVDMRGFGESGLSNYLVLIDGRRINQIDLSGADLSLIDLGSIERIEIVRGANSVLYGDNATGGVINIITKRGSGDCRIKYTQEAGSYQYHKEYFSIDGGHEFLDYFFNYSYQDSDGFRLNNGYEANDIFTSFTVKPADFCDLRLSSGYHRDWYGSPGAMFPVNLKSDGREGSRWPNDKTKTEDYFFTVDPTIFGGTQDHDVNISAFMAYSSRRTNAVLYNTFKYEVNHHIVTLEFKPKCEINSLLLDGSLENKFVAGVDYFRAEDQILSGARTALKSQLDIIKTTTGVYGHDKMIFEDKFILNGGVRGEWAEYIFDEETIVPSYNMKQSGEIAFDAGVGYKYNNRSQVYGTYARSYRYPNTEEYFSSAYLDYPPPFFWPPVVVPAILHRDLQHQVGDNYEIGIKDNSFEPVTASVSYYLIDNRNEILFDRGKGSFGENSNYPHTVHHGCELETSMTILEKIYTFFNYTFQESFFVGGKYAGNTIPLVPENKITAGVGITPAKGIDLNCVFNYVGARYKSNDLRNHVPKLKSYFTTDLNLSVEIGNLRVFGSIKNLFNEKYFAYGTTDAVGSYEAFYPSPERSYEGGVSVLF